VGPEIAEKLRVDLPDLRTILITGFLRDQLSEALEGWNVDCVLEKPFQLDELIEAVGRAFVGPGAP